MPPPWSTPAVSAATRWQTPLRWGALTAVLLAGFAGSLAIDPSSRVALASFLPVLGLVAALAALLAAGLLPTWLVVAARAALARAEEAHAAQAVLTSERPVDATTVAQARAVLIQRAGTQHLATLAVPGLAVLLLTWWLWPQAPTLIGAGWAIAAGLLGAAFPLLIAERFLSAAKAAELPEGPALARLLRLGLWALVIAGVAILLGHAGQAWAAWLIKILLVLLGLVGLELLLRGCAVLFSPPTAPEQAAARIDSLLAGLMVARLDPRRALAEGLKERYGIDWSQSVALRLAAQAMPPLLLALALLAWLSTSLSVLGVAERGICTTNGMPVRVLGPGLHLHLPWPFGAVRRLELGVVHRIELTDRAPSDGTPLPAADAEPDADSDRVWERAHPQDQLFLVPGGDGVQLMNAELAVLYRIGLDDADALRFHAAAAEPSTCVALHAARLLSAAFGGQDLHSLIASDREALRRLLHTDLQTALDADASGLEVVEVLVTSLHPSATTAAAWQQVQVAGIEAATDLASERARAITGHTAARANATELRDHASAEAQELRSAAIRMRHEREGDARAHAAGGRGWQLERWLGSLRRALANSRLLLIDHRLGDGEAATLDLRGPAAFADPGEERAGTGEQVRFDSPGYLHLRGVRR